MATRFLNHASSPLSSAKIHVAHTCIRDSYLDPTQPPTKQVPFRQIHDVRFVKSVRLCLPTKTYNDLYDGLPGSTTANGDAMPTTRFSKVMLTLHDILQDHSIRTGNFLMLAQPHPASPIAPSMPSSNSTTMSFNQGMLTVEMPHSVSERAGLGAAFKVMTVASGGRKHEKQTARYRVSVDLRKPNMVKGKPAFDRLLWASREVEGLREGRLWLVTDADSRWHKIRQLKKKRKRTDSEQQEPTDKTNTTAEETTLPDVTEASTHPQDPMPIHLAFLKKHHPTTTSVLPRTTQSKDILVPDAIRRYNILASLSKTTSRSTSSLSDIHEEDTYDLVEYLGLLFMKSPRICQESYGKIDPYLCRYALPNGLSYMDTQNDQDTVENRDQPVAANSLAISTENLTFIEYSGLISMDFVLQLVVDLIRRSRVVGPFPDQPGGDAIAWASLQAMAHPTEVRGGTDGYVILLQAGSGLEETPQVVGNQDTSANTEDDAVQEEGKELSSNRLRYATCFEFVDSIVQ